MWHVPGELDTASLRPMRRLMHFLWILPPRSHLHYKLLYSIALLAYIWLVFRWRYNLSRIDGIHDKISHVVDLAGILALLVGHCVVAMELLWFNRSNQIEQQFQEICDMMSVRFGRQVNFRRLKGYCEFIYRFVFIRIAVLLAVTIYNYIARSNLFLLLNVYSEILFTLRCCEFALHSLLVLAFFQEMQDAANEIIFEMERIHLELSWDYSFSTEDISILQQLHLMLWKTQRDIEHNFMRSLIFILIKNFADSSVTPYWVFLNIRKKRSFGGLQLYGLSQEFGKLLEICIPCWICTRCDQLQRQFRSLFHGLSLGRHNDQLNTALLRISVQLGQETSRFSVGGFLIINNEMLGKFLFGILSYFIVCIQFQLTFIDNYAESTVNIIPSTEPNYSTYA